MALSLQTFKIERSVRCADRPITVEEFLGMFGEDELAELIDGTVVLDMVARYDHEALSTFLLSLLKVFVEGRDLGVVLGSRSLIRIDPYTGLMSDVLFISSDRRGIIRETEIIGPPDLVVEIASPSEAVPDLIRKQAKYEMAGVRELWIIDRRQREVKAYRLGEGVRYEPMPIKGGVLRSEVVRGFWVRTDWLFAEPERMPKVLEALREIEGVS